MSIIKRSQRGQASSGTAQGSAQGCRAQRDAQHPGGRRGGPVPCAARQEMSGGEAASFGLAVDDQPEAVVLGGAGDVGRRGSSHLDALAGDLDAAPEETRRCTVAVASGSGAGPASRTPWRRWRWPGGMGQGRVRHSTPSIRLSGRAVHHALLALASSQPVTSRLGRRSRPAKSPRPPTSGSFAFPGAHPYLGQDRSALPERFAPRHCRDRGR
jgi:hypothetical protein